MATHWTIHPLQIGEFTEYDRSGFTYARNAGVKMLIPFVIWLLRSGETSVLIDTGPSAPEVANRLHPHSRRSPEQEPEAALRAAGVDPARIKLVILSHLHWDHCYNLELFPEARFVVQAEELRAAVDPIPTQKVAYEVGFPGLQPSWMSVFDRIQVVRGDIEIAPGLQLVMLPGHTPGLQGVLVETAAGRCLVPSDSVPLYENLGPEGGDPIPPGIHTDVATCLRSMEQMKSLARVILPSHDPEVFRQSVYPVL